MQRLRAQERRPSRVVGSILGVNRRGRKAESVDESFWGSPRRLRPPLSGSYVVDILAAAVLVLVFLTIAGLAALWPHGSLGQNARFGPIHTVGAVAERGGASAWKIS